ncbi:MAG: hypothetical protein LWY06_11515 [Firmicutes bacterium]|nr:hypothetical protein [Bacillota bacterium]
MEIRREICLSNIDYTAKQNIQPSIASDKTPGDTVEIGNKKHDITVKPDIKTSPSNTKVIKPEQTQEAVPPHSLSITASLVSGPAAAVIDSANQANIEKTLKSLENRCVEFFREKSFHIPLLQDKFDKIDSGEAAGTISRGTTEEKQKLRVRENNSAYLPILDSGDIKELEAFYLTGSVDSLQNKQLGELITDLKKDGYEFQNSEGEKTGPYGAYNDLKNPNSGKEIKVCELDTPFFTIKPEDISDMEKLGKRLTNAKKTMQLIKQDDNSLRTVTGKTGRITFESKLEAYSRLLQPDNRLDITGKTLALILDNCKNENEFKQSVDFYIKLQPRSYDPTQRADAIRAIQYFNTEGRKDKATASVFKHFMEVTKDSKTAEWLTEILNFPVRNETREARLEVLQNLAANHKKSAIQAYEAIKGNLKQGETLKEAYSDFRDLNTAVNDPSNNGYTSIQAFEFIRTKLSNQPEDTALYKDFLINFRNHWAARETLGQIKEPVGNSDISERAEVAKKIHILTSGDSKKDYYSFICQNTDRHQSLTDVFDKFAVFYKPMKNNGYRSDEICNAFSNLSSTITKDSEDTQRLVQVLKAFQHYDDMIEAAHIIRQDLPGSTIDNRLEAMLTVSKYLEPVKMYKALLTPTAISGNIAQNAKQAVLLHEAKEGGGYTFDKTIDLLTKFKSSFADHEKLFPDFTEIASVLKQDSVLEQIIQIASETNTREPEEDKFKALKKVVLVNNKEEHQSHESMENLKTVNGNTNQGETIKEASERFTGLWNLIKDSSETRKAFKFINSELKDGLFKGQSISEASNEFRMAMLTSDSVDKAIGNIKYKREKQEKEKAGLQTITNDGEFVTIGGIKIKKNK